MEIIITISQALLYLSFSILMGSFFLPLVPRKERPDVNIPKQLLLVSSVSVPIFAFFPVLDIIFYISPRLGIYESFKMVLGGYTIGTSWVFTLLVSIILVFLIASTKETTNGTFAFLGILLTMGLILTVAWSSHAGGISPTVGIVSDFLHLLAVSIWIGILLIIGWYASNQNNWFEFLYWYSIVAITCLVLTALSGLFLMDVLIDNYINSWMISYGQGLLIKHLFLIPIIYYALVNRFIVKRKLVNDPSFNPLPWIRLEGFILFIVFVITAYFSQQPPAHGNYVSNEAVSPLFRLFHDDFISGQSKIDFIVTSSTVGLFFLAIVFLGLNILLIYKKPSILLSFLFSCLFVISVYFMLMVTIVVR